MKLLALKVHVEKDAVGVLVPLQWSEIHALYWAELFIEATEKVVVPEIYEPVSVETLADTDMTGVGPIIETSIQRAGRFTRRTWRKIAEGEGMPESVKNAIIKTLDEIE